MANNLNISSVISPDVLKNISSAAVIKTFGDQLVDKTTQKVISVVEDKAKEIEGKIEKLVKNSIQLGIDHNTELKRLDVLHKEGQLTDDQYNEAITNENASYNLAIQRNEEEKTQLKDDLAKLLSDPYKKLKDDYKKKKADLKKLITKTKGLKLKANRDKLKKLAKNVAKTLAPVVALQLSNQLLEVISQRGKLETLVDQVNAYIEQANTAETIAIATNLRNNTITLINNSIKKLQNIQNVLNQITLYITIFSALVAVLSAIPIPVAVPPGIGIPFNLITRIVQTLEKANKLIASLAVILAIVSIALENEVSALNDLIARLKEISALLDSNALNNLDTQELQTLTSSLLTNVDQYPEYKGFKFKVKEEQTLGASQAVTVKGIKRHYAVAIDRDGVEILKSEYSFTLDPNDLVEQLKLIIDQKNLQG